MDEALTVICFDYKIQGMEEFFPAIWQGELHFEE